ncbi:jasmonate-induced oxygenase 2 isoform X1 [Elaeis guineensis]|uniref:Probable 2-oxoglutarate-dependent dioxygenase At5g05600 isoform X1 n=1 Tax=Elaeis guineensis var. tenera TaxID=51953 RepID=A0A6I9SDY6_ELAGV|nr:probable 2-oxoglutarate-dependent dioxygenase At5g05600 isoform X1 [Elaeis guineensis]
MDCIQDWPEPVVRVQSLSDSGATRIPERYVKPAADRPSSAPCADLRIPVIDLATLASDGPVDCAAVVQAVSGACRDWGFFQVVNHGVDPSLIRRIREVWGSFFHLPMEAKQVYANSPKTYEGYGSRLGIEKGAILDWGDYYFLHVLPSSLKSLHKWPALPPTLSRETTDEYSREVLKLCERVMKVLSLGLGLEDDFLQKAFGGDDAGACMRVNFYPKCPQPDLTLGLSSHSDPGGITVLLADDRVKGLQVRRGDAWVTVQPVPDAFIINVGDQVQVLSNATYKSVEHRVVVNSETERLSFAFFYNPKSDLLIRPAPELVTSEHPALYPPMSFDEYRLYIRRKGPRGKSQVESLKAV